MKILFLTLSKFSQFPTYKRAVGMGEALAVLGHSVSIAVLDCDENRARMAKEAPHCEVVWFPRSGVLREALVKFRAVWHLRPDVVYSTSYSPRNLSFLGWLLPRRTRKTLEFCELYSAYGQTQGLWKIKERIALRENDCILCASRYLYDYFVALMNHMNVARRMIYSPYAYPDYLRPMEHKISKRKTVVFMAALFANYGVYDVIGACEKLIQKGVDLELEVLGGGPEKEAAREQVFRDGMEERIRIRGFVPEEDLNGYFSRADVFVSPLHDTVQDKARCPSKIFYYIPYNKPIVTCALGDPLETLGENGFYYKPDDVDDMSRVIGEALAASERFAYPDGFIARHSWRARAEELMTLIEWRMK